jgi:hypothetical protein
MSGRMVGWAWVRRALIGAAVVVPGAALIADPLVGWLIPLYRLAFETLVPELRVLALETTSQGGHHVVLAKVTLARMTVIGQTVLWPDARGIATASTPLAHALHMPTAALLVSAAWPAASAGRVAARVLLAVGLAAVWIPVDVPAVLAANLWRILLDHHAPGAFSPLLVWAGFVSGGGRWMLGAAMGVAAALAVTGRTPVRPQPPAARLSASPAARADRGPVRRGGTP